MKVCVIQPYYSFDPAELDLCFTKMLELMDQCDESMDLIVLPEYCDIPAATESCEQFHASLEHYNPIIREKVAALAKRCNAVVFANFADRTDNGWRNTTFAFDRSGREVGKYYKAHPAPSEVKTALQGGNELDCSYSYRYREPDILELDGVRYGFMTCYDFYMYEAFPVLARRKPDIIIGCSHQRTDSHDALELFGKFLCYNTNAYLVRSAVSLGENSEVCGCSMIVSPEGKMLLNMKNAVGLGVFEIDPKQKFYKAAGFKGAPKAHWEYIEEGRRPWLYRPGGSMTVPDDEHMPYPRICAHRGFSTIAPENSMPAYGAAVAMGAQEIEFDLWWTKDGEIVSIHDGTLDRVSTGTGNVWEHTYEELLQYDFGLKTSEKFKGLKILRFEEILQKFAGQVIMNIHIKDNGEPYDESLLRKIVALIDKYDCRRYVYFMSGFDDILEKLMKIAPDITRCCGAGRQEEKRWNLVDRAIRYDCKKIQLYLHYFNQEMIDKAHANGIICNYFYADDEQQARDMMEMGIDTMLTNDYLKISTALKPYFSK
ncbi:MAG: hypothetical protein MJ118_06365 [Clostridia bacterium]|nr:hypothetical protein [Clostridia bacterium]